VKFLRPTVVLVVFGLPLVLGANVEAAINEPYELVRTLRTVQDQIVQGNRTAHQAHRRVMTTIADQLMKVEADKWREDRNIRAGMIFALSGGDPRVVRQVLGLVTLNASDDRLMKGSLAYAEGRNSEALELMAGINPLTLDAGIAGHVALAQGVLLSRDEPNRATSHFEMARLLSPGTLIEETSLRRELLMLSKSDNVDRFESLAKRYMRRFRNSVYADNFRLQLVTEVASAKSWDNAQRLAKIEKVLSNLDDADRQDAYLVMAQVGLTKGNVTTARFAAEHASAIVIDQVDVSPQARVYEAAALIVTDKFEDGVVKLKGVERDKLGAKDAQIFDAAMKVADQVRRWPQPGLQEPASAPSDNGSARARDLAAVGARTVEVARAAMTKVDATLKTRSR
jgi:chemotaxis protein MotC